MKDKEWLKAEVKKILRDKVSDGINYYDYMDLKRSLNELINQLNEPEVLSQEWIDNNSVNASSDGVTEEYVHVDDLENLLVPKQEELEVKIQELIEAYKQEEDAYGELENGWISGFIKDLKNLVEEEQKYYVLTSSNKNLLIKDDGEVRETYQVYSWTKERDKECYQFTEQEIKDYDERFWAFAVPVELAE